ncbi:MAG: prohibitin family protein [Saprospiraceae bacterium]|jgi:regulator of protease activity HflC (stomatin/prohibitin superfamily)|nr:prohibitin family protein [Saprospiraceae bacterium]
MFLAVLGIFIAIIASTVSKANPNLGSFGKIGRFIGIALVALGILTACFVQISPGTVGVQTLFGKVQAGVLSEGLNVVNPLVDVITFDIRTQNYTMSGVRDEGEKMGDDAIHVLSSDGLEVEIDLTVLFRIVSDKAPEILRTIGQDYRDVIVRPLVRTKIRDFAAYYDAVSLYSTKRDEFQQRLSTAIEKEFKDRGLVMEQVLIRNINLPQSVKAAIEAKINAEQESQKMKFVLDKERQEADRKRVEAQGIADYQRILTASLTDKLIQYEQIKVQKELVTSPNAKIIIMGNGKSAPILIGQ